MNKNHRVHACCFGGPYNGAVISLSNGVDRTLIFTAKGMTGYYRRDGKWVEKGE